MIKKIKHILEACAIFPFFWIMKVLPKDISSEICCKLAVFLGPHVKVHKIAKYNLKLAFPELRDEEIESIAKKMWSNLGRMVGEFPHINSMADDEFNKRVSVKNNPLENGNPSLLISAHFGNFEMASRIFSNTGKDVSIVYRPANNPYVDNLINKARTSNRGIKPIPKGTPGVRKMLLALKNNESIGMLVDQKTNTGEEIDFFGIPARTTMLPANLAIKHNVPIYLMRIRRTGGFNFEVDFEGPLNFGKGAKPKQIMEKINNTFEAWIKKDPEQWFWVHKRWGKI